MKVRGGPLPYLRAARILDLPMVDRALKPSFGRVEIENRAILPVILYICNNTRFVILCDPKALNSCLFYAVSIEIAYPIPVISLPPHQLIPQGELRWTTACPGKEKGDSIQPQITADFVWAGFYYERTGSPDQSQYIWRKTISHIEVVLGSGVFPVLQWCPPGMTFQIFVPANGLFLRASMGTNWTRFDWQLYVPFHSLKEVSAGHSWYIELRFIIYVITQSKNWSNNWFIWLDFFVLPVILYSGLTDNKNPDLYISGCLYLCFSVWLSICNWKGSCDRKGC